MTYVSCISIITAGKQRPTFKSSNHFLRYHQKYNFIGLV